MNTGTESNINREQTGHDVTPLLTKFTHNYAKSQIVFDENGAGKEMYIVHSGKVGLYKGHGKKRVLLSVVKPGDFFGEMALVDNSPRSATAITLVDNTKLVSLDKAKFLYILRHQPEFALIIMEKLCQILRKTTELATHKSISKRK